MSKDSFIGVFFDLLCFVRFVFLTNGVNDWIECIILLIFSYTNFVFFIK